MKQGTRILRLVSGAVAAGAVALVPLCADASLLDEPPKAVSFKLDDPVAPKLDLLQPFHHVDVERPGPVGAYVYGRWGRWFGRSWVPLAWPSRDASVAEPADDVAGAFANDPSWDPPSWDDAEDEPSFADRTRTFAQAALDLVRAGSPGWLDRIGEEPLPPVFAWAGPSLSSNGFDALFVAPKKPVPWTERCFRRPVTFIRYSGENSAFALVGCDGAAVPGAFERLAIVARPPEVPSPGEELPDEPDPEAWQHGEWIQGVHLMQPRVLWLLQRIADAFPWRAVYVYSGYRPKVDAIPRSHHSLHGQGRAMDIQVMGVPNEALFAFCRTLDDVGCGYYPNSKFVHVDVRRPGTGHAFWIDASGPGEPSRYVDSWPGVVDHGGMVTESVYDE